MSTTVLFVTTIDRGAWKFTGGDTPIHLVATGTNALSREPWTPANSTAR